MERQNEYLYFIENHKLENIDYRKNPPKIFKPLKFEWYKWIGELNSNDLTNTDTPINLNEPLSFLQYAFAEPLRYNYILNLAADQDNIVNRLILIAAFSVSTSHALILGRWLKPYDPIIGETYEYIDPENKVLSITENISNDPPIWASHAQNKEWELTTVCNRITTYKSNKLSIDFNTQRLFKFKKDNKIYFSNHPKMVLHDYNTSYRWVEYNGKQKIGHFESKAHVQLTYYGCTKYCYQDCIKGDVYDAQNNIVGHLRGHYLTKLTYTDKETDISTVVWQADPNDEVFYDYFSFSRFTLTLNDPQHHTECPTDTRKRKDIRYLEVGDYDSSQKCAKFLQTYFQSKNTTETGTLLKYEPKWFKKVDSEFKNMNYEYTNEYWYAKLNNDFSRSENVFPKDNEY